MINQEYLPCNRQIHIKISDEELKLIRERMEQCNRQVLFPKWLEVKKFDLKLGRFQICA